MCCGWQAAADEGEEQEQVVVGGKGEDRSERVDLQIEYFVVDANAIDREVLEQAAEILGSCVTAMMGEGDEYCQWY